MSRGKFILSVGLIGLSLGLILCSSQIQGQVQQDTKSAELKAAARSLLDLLAKGDFAAAEQKFDESMKTGLPKDKLEAAWKAVVSQYGPLKKPVSIRQGKAEEYDIIEIKCEFEKEFLATRVVFNAQGKISGLFFVPVK